MVRMLNLKHRDVGAAELGIDMTRLLDCLFWDHLNSVGRTHLDLWNVGVFSDGSSPPNTDNGEYARVNIGHSDWMGGIT